MSDPIDYTSVPPGTYRCRIAEVRDRETRGGDVLLALRLVVADGDVEGRTAAWDNLVFSSRGVARVRQVLRALGVKLDRPGELDLVGAEALVTVRPAEYLSADGETIRRNEVPYDGYRAVDAYGQAPRDLAAEQAKLADTDHVEIVDLGEQEAGS